MNVGKIEDAERTLAESFAFPFRDGYLRGKTCFRDAIYEKLGCSLLEAENLVDALEKSGKIKFRRPRGGMGSGQWEKPS